ncbi:ATP-binding protein [Roseomonas sp. 18066]|uniref:PAS domain-containing sensor histidine kinase n=1 Tax=Roseomonas sp. 18066 TaxID=2681412 RepID=UPI00135915C3|nr:ATP-binding protein [Roseomonas sp. 18066]
MQTARQILPPDAAPTGIPTGIPMGAPVAGLSPQGRRRRLFLLLALVAGVFAVDGFTSLSSAIAVLYVLVPLLAADTLPKRGVVALALLCGALALVSYGLGHGLQGEAPATLRLVFSLVALGAATLLALRSIAARALQAEQARLLAASESRYRTIFETLAVGIWEHDFRPVQQALADLRAAGVADLPRYLAEHPDFVIATRRLVNITDVNTTALKLLGVPSKEKFFTHLANFLPETDESFAECLIALDEGRPHFTAEARLRAADGSPVDIIVALNFPPPGESLARVQASVLDITERRRMQDMLASMRAELERAGRVAALGELAAAIAHEVNQPLSAIRAGADAARRWLTRDPPELEEARAALEEVGASARHGGEVVRRIRHLLGKSEPERLPLDLAELVAEALRLVQRELQAAGVALTLELAPGLLLRGDRILLQQLFVNLATNALQAMQALPAAERRLLLRAEAVEGMAELRVQDSGPGFCADGAARAFDAFFSTRPGGMGLGLAVSRSIVEAHDGMIAIDPGPGGRLRLALPLALA